MSALLRIERLSKSYGALKVTQDVSFDVRPGELHAIIGPNGAGKTTLIHQISGTAAPSAGRILFDGRNITGFSMAERVRAGLARSFQITSILPRFTALENVAVAVRQQPGRHMGAATQAEALQ
jgi:branched-chain amino acid transport system ATP-binding protein